MPYFEYEAINPRYMPLINKIQRNPRRLEEFVDQLSSATHLVSGTIEADNPEHAVAILNQRNLVPLRLSIVIRGADGIQQLMKFTKQRDKLMKLTQPTPSLQPARKINYAAIIGIIGVITLIILALW